jgi:hypothetical protein
MTIILINEISVPQSTPGYLRAINQLFFPDDALIRGPSNELHLSVINPKSAEPRNPPVNDLI